MQTDTEVFRSISDELRADMNRAIVEWAKTSAPSLTIGDVFKLASDVSSIAVVAMNTTWQSSRDFHAELMKRDLE